MGKPLSGIRILELAGIGPCPLAGMLLADMGAEVILVRRPGPVIPTPHDRGKLAVTLDLHQSGAADALIEIAATCDGLIEGLRPGVMERLGVGPESVHAANPALVYGRMTGWGQTGPWAKTAGHDLNYVSITGALAAMGEPGRLPVPPLNFVGDYGGGTMFLVMGVLAALLQAKATGRGCVVDAAMTDGVNAMMSVVRMLDGLGMWQAERGANLLDGAMPYYRCYECADGKHIAVGCIEPQFFAVFLDRLGIDAGEFGDQNDRKLHPVQHARLEAHFATRPRGHWAELFDGTDACVSPVLDYREALDHPQNVARESFTRAGPFVHQRPAPVFDGELEAPVTDIPITANGMDRVAELAGWSEETVEAMKASGILQN